MKHHAKTRKLGRTRKVRKALLRSLAEALVLNDKIKTTEAKAKEIRPLIEKLVTKAKNDTLTNRRLLIARLGHKEAVEKMFKEIGDKYKGRQGGYTRIIKLPARGGDGSPMAIIEFV